jgi:hypothetical protein
VIYINANEVSLIVNTVSNRIQQEPWFDFEVIKYNKNELVIGGGKSLSYPHELEILFKDVFFVSMPVEWRTDTSKNIFTILEGDEKYNVNKRFQVEQGYFIFKFFPEDYPNDFGCLICAKSVDVKFQVET